MGITELEFSFECLRRRVLNKLKRTKEHWRETWEKNLGDREAEAELVAIKLEIQLREKEAITELGRLKLKIERQKKCCLD
ncbi:MAG: hypothetical protein KKC80_08340 [Candidatus Margulisbacteria bacterium]|nr:hypothetical protein [Candidatus Margulisiibacteriota bacterium]MBU1617775.1 hypothetical protein [Candidatus Margulisiibacteriota bacterium]MBU1867834.1 hypothetical protein [Candidatus Margulisiibacteriota bacterium]